MTGVQIIVDIVKQQSTQSWSASHRFIRMLLNLAGNCVLYKSYDKITHSLFTVQHPSNVD